MISSMKMDDVINDTKEILWEVIQCGGIQNLKGYSKRNPKGYSDSMAITLHHYRRIQSWEHKQSLINEATSCIK